MPLKMTAKTKGGKKLKAAIQNARKRGGVHAVQAGFFGSDKNEQGQPLSNVAAVQEFGAVLSRGAVVPERPFMRKANAAMRSDVLKAVRDNINPATLQVDDKTAEAVGKVMVEHIQSSILSTNDPANAPITRARKGGKTPLVDSGAMLDGVRYEVIQ